MPTVPNESWSRAKDVITVLVVPAIAWIFMQVGAMSRMEIEIRTLHSALNDNKADIQYLRDRDSNVSQQIAKLEARFDAIETVLVGLQKTMDKLDSKLERLDERLDRVERYIAGHSSSGTSFYKSTTPASIPYASPKMPATHTPALVTP
jgi:septal ring factor EnvC (AmiA/AmiB activator)